MHTHPILTYTLLTYKLKIIIMQTLKTIPTPPNIDKHTPYIQRIHKYYTHTSLKQTHCTRTEIHTPHTKKATTIIHTPETIYNSQMLRSTINLKTYPESSVHNMASFIEFLRCIHWTVPIDVCHVTLTHSQTYSDIIINIGQFMLNSKITRL